VAAPALRAPAHVQRGEAHCQNRHCLHTPGSSARSRAARAPVRGYPGPAKRTSRVARLHSARPCAARPPRMPSAGDRRHDRAGSLMGEVDE
jgi:hypothetical protein